MTRIEVDQRIGIIHFGRRVDFNSAFNDLNRLSEDAALVACEAFIWDLVDSDVDLDLAELRELTSHLRDRVPPGRRPRKTAIIANSSSTRSVAMIARSLLMRDSDATYELFEHERAARNWLLVRKPRTGEQVAVA